MSSLPALRHAVSDPGPCPTGAQNTSASFLMFPIVCTSGTKVLRMACGGVQNYSHINYDPFPPIQTLPSPVKKKIGFCVCSMIFNSFPYCPLFVANPLWRLTPTSGYEIVCKMGTKIGSTYRKNTWASKELPTRLARCRPPCQPGG